MRRRCESREAAESSAGENSAEGSCFFRRVAALGEALSHAFRVTLVHTVPGRTLTLPYALLRPPERQRRLTWSPRRPSDDRIASAAAILALLASAKTPKMARRSGQSTAVSCISRSFRTFNACPRLLYRVWRPKTRHDASMSVSAVQIPRRHPSICAHPRLERAAPRLLWIKE